jgi:hypothetical protein
MSHYPVFQINNVSAFSLNFRIFAKIFATISRKCENEIFVRAQWQLNSNIASPMSFYPPKMRCYVKNISPHVPTMFAKIFAKFS